jgi:hypothetical protein
MLDVWSNQITSNIQSVTENIRTLSLSVLAATGFRRSYKFHSMNDIDKAPDEADSYRDALQTVLDNCIMLITMSQECPEVLKSTWFACWKKKQPH